MGGKWFAIMIIGVALSFAVGGAASDYSKAQVEIAKIQAAEKCSK